MRRYDQKNDSSAALALLNRGGSALVRSALHATILALPRDDPRRPLRIVDIGCGAKYYVDDEDKEALGALSVTMVDKSDAAYKAFQERESSYPEAVFHHDDFLTMNLDALGDEPADIVLLAFALHELRAQTAVDLLMPDRNPSLAFDSDPAQAVFRRIRRAPFYGERTRLILAEVFHWPFWAAEVLEKARLLQREQLKHADPAAAFLPGAEVVRLAAAEGFEHLSYEVAASVEADVAEKDELLRPLVRDPVCGRVFTSRRAFCTVLRSVPPAHAGGHTDGVDTALPRGAGGLASVVRKALAGDQTLRASVDAHLHRLRAKLTQGRAVDSSIYDEEVGRGLFPLFARAAGTVVKECFATSQILGPRELSFWFSLNSLVHPEKRYAVKDVADGATRWRAEHISCTGDGVRIEPDPERDWPTLCYNAFASKEAVDDAVADHPWLEGADAPSIYRLMTESEEREVLRSVSIICPPVPDGTAEPPPRLTENGLVLRDFSRRDGAGRSWSADDHVLIALPGDRDRAYELGAFLDECTDRHYCGRDGGPEGPLAEARRIVMRAIGALYLDATFLSRYYVSAGEDDPIKRFKDRWLESPEAVAFVEGSADGTPVLDHLRAGARAVLPARMRRRLERFVDAARAVTRDPSVLPVVWTSFVVEQPGVGAETEMEERRPIATIMCIADRPFEPIVLELFKAQFQKGFSSIRDVEAKRNARMRAVAEATAETTQSLLQSFGHDGRKPAQLIYHLLKGKNDLDVDLRNKQAAAVASALTSRMSGYTRLVDDESSRSATAADRHRLAWLEGIGQKPAEWCSITSLFEDELAFALLRVAVDPGGPWEELRVRLGLSPAQVVAIAEADGRFDAVSRVLGDRLKYRCDCDALRTPKRLVSSLATTTEPRVFHALHFLLAEILANAFRHEYANVPLNSLRITLTARAALPGEASPADVAASGAVLADLSLQFAPARAADFPAEISGSRHGLTSLDNVSRVIGAKMDRRPVKVLHPETGDELATLDLPFFSREPGSIIWRVLEVPCFREGSR